MAKRFRSAAILHLLLIFLTLPIIGLAANNNQSLSFEDWVDRLKKQALSQGISPETIQLAFLGIKQLPQTATFTTETTSYTLNQYLDLSLAPQQIDYQKRLLQHYGNILFEISHLFGVEPEVLIAVWTIDNLESRDKQNFNAIELLVSSSFQQPGDKLVQTELFNTLKLIDDKQVNPAQLTSDANGLLGSTYFKPSILRSYGIDYDGDGIIDVWKNYADIFASTANYLSSIGWKPKERWGFEVTLPEGFDPNNISMNSQYSIEHWRNLGVKKSDGSELPAEIALGSIIKPDILSDKAYLVLDNYFALLRWKRSYSFALAVGLMTSRLTPN